MGQVAQTSKRTVRPGVAIVAGVMTLGILFLLGRGAPTEGEEQDRAIAEVWIEEVHDDLRNQPCAFQAGSEHAQFASHLSDSAPLWEAQARLGSSEALRRAQVIQGWLACSNDGDLRERQALKETQTELLRRVAQSLRIQVALLRRAQAENQPADARAAVAALRELLDAHRGPLGQRLSQLEHRYKNASL